MPTLILDHSVERERLMANAMRADERALDEAHPSAVVWDLDSTVADTLHRHHMLEKIRAWNLAVKELNGGEERARELGIPKVTWDDYSRACLRDKPVESSITAMKLFWRSHLQIAVSGRGAVATSLTKRWVRAWKVPLDEVILRPEGDFTPSDEFKVREIKALEARGITVVLYVDDWPSSADAVANLGIPSLKFNPDYECVVCGASERACPCGAATIGGKGS